VENAIVTCLAGIYKAETDDTPFILSMKVATFMIDGNIPAKVE
jgi:hypothetical protein